MRVFNPGLDADGRPKDYRKLLDGAEDVPTIHLRRDGRGRATASIPQKWAVHSPDGFEWGYGGSGPADLALNIMGLFVEPPEAWRLHQWFKADVVAQLSRDAVHDLKADEIIDWIEAFWEAEDERGE